MRRTRTATGKTIAALAVIAMIMSACNFFNAAPSDCIQAAEEARLPEEMIDQLENPEGLNALERAALQQALKRAGIDEMCEREINEPSAAPSDHELNEIVATAVSQTREANEKVSEKTSPENQTRTNLTAADSTKTGLEGGTSGKQAQDDTTQEHAGGNYAQCLDEVFLRAQDDYDDYLWLSAAGWYCRHLEPIPMPSSNPARCNLDQVEVSQARYPEWDEILHYWHAVAVCDPRPTADATHIGRGASVTPTPYGACLDNAFLAYRQELGNSELVTGVSAWLCRDYLPTPPGSHRLRCDLDQLAATEELYPEWPQDIHEWHAIMHCLPEWELHTQIDQDFYSTCLGDVYAQVNENYSGDAAIASAVRPVGGNGRTLSRMAPRYP